MRLRTWKRRFGLPPHFMGYVNRPFHIVVWAFASEPKAVRVRLSCHADIFRKCY